MVESGCDYPANIKRQIDIPSSRAWVSPVVSLLPSPDGQDDRVSFLGAPMSLPYFRKWVDNWLASPKVGEMTLAQRGLFDHMLCVSWQTGPLPSDVTRLVRLLKVHRLTFGKLWVYPLVDCWKQTSKGLVNERLEKEREWAISKINKASKAARHRWDGHADAMQTHMQTHKPSICHPDPDPDPDPDPKVEEGSLLLLPSVKATAKKVRKPRKPKTPEFNVEWNGKDFDGPDIEALKNKLRARYFDDLGSNWVNAVWDTMLSWCEDNKQKIDSKKDYGQFVLTFFRTNAERRRER